MEITNLCKKIFHDATIMGLLLMIPLGIFFPFFRGETFLGIDPGNTLMAPRWLLWGILLWCFVVCILVRYGISLHNSETPPGNGTLGKKITRSVLTLAGTYVFVWLILLLIDGIFAGYSIDGNLLFVVEIGTILVVFIGILRITDYALARALGLDTRFLNWCA